MLEIIHVFGIDWRLLLVQAFNFGLLLVILTYFLYRPILRILSERQEKIQKGIDDARHAAQHLAEADAEGKARLTLAEKEAEELVRRGVVYGKDKGETLVRAAQEQSEALLTEAAAKVEEQKRQALLESKEEIAKMAVLAAERILRK